MKANSAILLELNISEVELLSKIYTRTAVKILTSELSLQEISELIEKLTIT